MINFTPLKDMILVKPDPRPERIGSIFVPDGALPQGHQAGEQEESYRDCFTGTVVAVGRGDKKRSEELERCPKCKKSRQLKLKQDGIYVKNFYSCDCETVPAVELFARITNSMDEPERHPMLTKVGDRVIYPRRPSSPGGEFSVKIDGEMYLIFNEQQNAFAVIED